MRPIDHDVIDIILTKIQAYRASSGKPLLAFLDQGDELAQLRDTWPQEYKLAERAYKRLYARKKEKRGR
jgi:hypothetical protein